MNIFQPTISGSLTISGSIYMSSLATTTSLSHLLLYNTSSGQIYYTASSAVGGGGGNGSGFPFLGNAVITGSLVVSGSSGGLSGITGSLSGTASYALTYPYNSTSSIIGDGLTTTFDIVHNFNTRDLHVTLYGNGTDYETIYADVRRPDLNTVRIVFGAAPTSVVVYISQ